MKNKKLFSTFVSEQLKLFLSKPLVYICGVIFAGFVYGNYFVRQQNVTGTPGSDLLLYLTSVPYICILVIPALCYKPNFAIYEDFLPFSRLQKLLANFVYLLICYVGLLVLLLPGVLVLSLIVSIDGGQLFTSFICLILYGAALISLTLLIQNITTSQVVSFIIAAIILAIFNNAHLISVYINTSSFIAELCKGISFAWHFDAASKGIIDTRDITFLTGATALFLLLNLIVKEKKAGKVYTGTQRNRVVLSIFLIILIILNGNNWYKRFDISKAQTFSIAKYTKQLTKKLDKNVKITYYRSSSLKKLYPQIRDVSDFLMIYAGQNKNISFQIKDPDKEQLTELLDNYGIYSQQLRSVKNNSTEFTNVYSAIVLEYSGNTEVIPFIMSAQSLEYDLDSRLLHLISGEDRIVNIIVGNGMTLSDDYSYLVPYLTSQGFVCNQLFPQDPAFVYSLEQTSGPLIIIGDEEIGIENAIAIESYILENKGNAFVTVSPFTAAIEDDWSVHYGKKTNIVEMVENWGITFEDEITADISCARITMYSQENTNTTQVINYPLWVVAMPQENCNSGVTVFWPTTMSVYNEELASPLIYSSNMAYTCAIERNNKESLIQTNPFVLNETPYNSDQKGTQILGAKINGKLSGLFNNFDSQSDVNLIVIPDQYFLNSLMNEYIGGDYGDYRNFDFLINSLLKLNNEDDLAELQSKSYKTSVKAGKYGKK